MTPEEEAILIGSMAALILSVGVLMAWFSFQTPPVAHCINPRTNLTVPCPLGVQGVSPPLPPNYTIDPKQLISQW